MAAFAALVVAVLLGWRDSRARLAFLALMFVELGWMATFYLPNRFDKDATLYTPPMANYQDLAEYLRSLPDEPRIMVDDQIVKFNFGDWYGVDVYGGYLASLTANLLDSGLHSPGVMRMMGVTHWAGSKPRDAGERLVLSGAKGLNLYAVADPLPRTWIVHRAFRADTKDQARTMIDNPAFDFRVGVVTNRDLELEDCAGSHAALLRRTSSRVVAGADAACRGLLVLGDVDYPGWKVRVDGKAAELLTVNLIQRGVVLEPGWHMVEFVYRPFSAIFGGLLTLLGTLLALGASIMRA
jgi:hypothetical protein